RELLVGEDLVWKDTGRTEVLRFSRRGGWDVLTNFGPGDYRLGDEQVLLSSSGALVDGAVPARTTVWIGPAEVRA
ncbi:MAG: alpha-amylase, partial [Ornithinimicrobium sp.]